MSADAVDRLCYDVSHDPALAARLRADPEGELAGRDGLLPEERAELLAGDVASLYGRGAHPVLLVRLGAFRVFGLDPARYASRITAAAPREEAGPEPEGPSPAGSQPPGLGTGVSQSSCASDTPRTTS